ncbi:hypothetical protein BIY29_07700 [Brenneria alni]|uniref:Pilus assembly protein PilO n=2 Tax=Brenneria alni TaxID=71656 RepID=A0A421DQ35_9GAMM|nr:hypothetical protein BIY29_07700 [Brenneria alni]
MFNWLVWISKPLWVLVIAQIVLISGFLLLGIWLVLRGEQQQIAEVKQQIKQQYTAVQHIQQQQRTMPTLIVMQRQLAEWQAANTPFHADMAAQLVSTMLLQSSASLLSWQLDGQQSNRRAWLLTFSADYQALLHMLRQFIGLPHVLRIEQLAMKSTDGVLHIEMTLVKPVAQRREDVE